MKPMDLVTVTQKFLDEAPQDDGRRWYGPNAWGGCLVGRLSRFCPPEPDDRQQFVVVFWGTHVSVLELRELQLAPDGSHVGCRPRKNSVTRPGSMATEASNENQNA